MPKSGHNDGVTTALDSWIRAGEGRSELKLAATSRVPRSVVNRVRHGMGASADHLVALAGATGIPLELLLSRKKKRRRKPPRAKAVPSNGGEAACANG